jgi:hypothetical protein
VTGADLATVTHIEAVLTELRAVRSELAQVRAALPSTWLSLHDAAERLGVDPRTCVAMGERGDIVIRRAGRRVLVDAGSLRPIDRATVAAMAGGSRR